MKTMGAHGAGNRHSPRQAGKGHRNQRTDALGKLESELGLDMLATALGVKDDSLKAIIQGRQPDADTRYFPHICNRLENAGIPASILDGLAPITSQVLKKLKGLAAASPDRTPLRRNNFKRLAKAFGERLVVLADALDIIPDTITKIADGTLQLDDQRFGHLNPRLMRAGFSNGWLNEADAQLPQTLIDSLAKLAEEEPEDEYVPPQVNVAPAPTLIPMASSVPANSDAADTKLAVSGQTRAPVTTSTSSSAKPGLSYGSIHRKLSGAARPMLANNNPGTENFMAGKSKTSDNSTSEAPASAPGGLKGSTLLTPAGTPGAGLPPGMRQAGRALAGRPAPTPRSAAGKAPSTTSAASATDAGAKAATPPTDTAANAQLDLTESTKDALGSSQRVAAVRQVAKRSGSAADGTEPITREISTARATALEQLLETARRKAKITLWRDLLGWSLAYWGNIRRGGILLRDPLANEITELLQLPQGWLDNPSFPPETLATWVTDPNVPLPTTKEEAKGIAAPSSATPPANVPAAAAQQPDAPEPKRRGPKPGAKAAARAAAAAAQQAATAQQAAQSELTDHSPAKEPAPATQAPAPTVAQAHPASNTPHPAAVTFAWKPAETPEPIPEAGPLVQAMSSTVDRLARQGKFTEQDAMRFLYYIMNQPGA